MAADPKGSVFRCSANDIVTRNTLCHGKPIGAAHPVLMGVEGGLIDEDLGDRETAGDVGIRFDGKGQATRLGAGQGDMGWQGRRHGVQPVRWHVDIAIQKDAGIRHLSQVL